jgi:hypothetical protein
MPYPLPVYDLTGLGGFVRKLLDLALVDPVEKPMKLVRDPVLRQGRAIGVCRDRKAIGNSDPLGSENRI